MLLHREDAAQSDCRLERNAQHHERRRGEELGSNAGRLEAQLSEDYVSVARHRREAMARFEDVGLLLTISTNCVGLLESDAVILHEMQTSVVINRAHA